MREPRGVAIHGDNLYVTDTDVHSIFHFKIATDFPLIAKRGSFGQQIGKFNSPRNLAVSNNGDVYVTDRITTTESKSSTALYSTPVASLNS